MSLLTYGGHNHKAHWHSRVHHNVRGSFSFISLVELVLPPWQRDITHVSGRALPYGNMRGHPTTAHVPVTQRLILLRRVGTSFLHHTCGSESKSRYTWVEIPRRYSLTQPSALGTNISQINMLADLSQQGPQTFPSGSKTNHHKRCVPSPDSWGDNLRIYRAVPTKWGITWSRELGLSSSRWRWKDNSKIDNFYVQ